MKLPKTPLKTQLSGKLVLYLLLAICILILICYSVFMLIWPEIFNQVGWSAFFVLAIMLTIIGIAAWGMRKSNEKDQYESRISELGHRLTQTQKHQQIVFQFSRNLVDAENESDMIEQVLLLAVETTGAQGAAFVPFDERQQPIAATSLGALPEELMNPWAEHLAAQKVQHRCKACERLSADEGDDCPLLNISLRNQFPDIQHVHCITLQYGERRVGMLTLFIKDQQLLDPEIEEFLRAIVDETALGLESIRLRNREMYALHQVQLLRKKTDLEGMISGLLDDIENSLDADFSIFTLLDPNNGAVRLRLQKGELAEKFGSFIEGVQQGVIASGEPLMMNEVISSKRSMNEVRAILAAPINSTAERSVGALVVGKYSENTFSKRQLELLVTLTGYLSLIVENAASLSEIEYKTMLDERNRLAREIHDGLAQTLGFLKLQVAQLQNYLNRNDYQTLEKGLQTTYLTLADAYLEVRDAIDGLRTNPTNEDIERWLQDLLADFEETSGIHADVDGSHYLLQLAPEIQVQLVRIIQEGLSNIRKHSHATRIALIIVRMENEIIVELKDDGRGFSPDEVSLPAQYGLQGMRERAELISADFQVISRPHHGTTIHLRIFSPKKEKA